MTISINRSFYSFAIFITALFTAVGLFQAIIYFLLGRQTYSLESFASWYLVANVISLVGTVVLLLYYHHKKFQPVFWMGLISQIMVVLQFVLVYSMLMGNQQLGNYYVPAHLAVVLSGVVYALTLIFTEAGKRRWLRAGGIFILIVGLVLLAVVIWYMSPPNPAKIATVEKIHQWISLVAALIPILFILNFLDEQRALKKETSNSPPPVTRTQDTLGSVIGFVTVLVVMITGGMVASQTTSKLSWEKHLAVKAKEWETLFEGRTFTGTKGSILKYQLLKPLNFDPQKKYPLVVGLPYNRGVEGCPPAQLLLEDIYRRQYPSFLFVPYCPEGEGWGGIPNYPTIDTLVFESIRALQEEFKEIDTKKIYVTGVSRGGYGSWHFIAAAPEMFAAAVPICGGEDAALAKNMVDVSVWAFHGEDDRNVPVKLSRDLIEAMKTAGADPKYTEFKGEGHNIWEKVKHTPGLWDWLFAQQREFR